MTKIYHVINTHKQLITFHKCVDNMYKSLYILNHRYIYIYTNSHAWCVSVKCVRFSPHYCHRPFVPILHFERLSCEHIAWLVIPLCK